MCSRWLKFGIRFDMINVGIPHEINFVLEMAQILLVWGIPHEIGLVPEMAQV